MDLKMFVNILTKEAQQSLHLFCCFAFLFIIMMSQCRTVMPLYAMLGTQSRLAN
jgi:hypothetical protein